MFALLPGPDLTLLRQRPFDNLFAIKTQQMISDIPDDLVAAFSEQPANVVLLVGSGLSRNVKRPDGRRFPSWKTLIEEMLRWALQRGERITEDERVAVELLISQNSPVAFTKAAGWLRRKIGEPNFVDFMVEQFPEQPRVTSVLHQRLGQLPHKGIVTFNYDVLLETALPSHYCTTQLDLNKLSYIHKGYYKPFILKAHGDIAHPSTIVLGQSDYAQITHHNPTYRKVISTIFEQNTVLALGCGLEDPDLEYLFDDILADFPNPPLKVIALAPLGRFDLITKDIWRSERKVRLLEYRPSNPTHPEVEIFVNQLLERVQLAQKQASSSRSSSFSISTAIPTRVKELRKELVDEDRRIVTAFKESGDGQRAANERAKLVDSVLLRLFEHAREELRIDSTGIALVAKGGYGRGYKSPFSNVNVSLLHVESVVKEAEQFSTAMHALLSDTFPRGGSRIMLVLNSIPDCDKKWRLDDHAFIAFASARVVAGDPDVQQVIKSLWREHAVRLDWDDFKKKLWQERFVQSGPPRLEGLSPWTSPGALLDIMIAECALRVLELRNVRFLMSPLMLKNAWRFWLCLSEIEDALGKVDSLRDEDYSILRKGLEFTGSPEERKNAVLREAVETGHTVQDALSAVLTQSTNPR